MPRQRARPCVSISKRRATACSKAGCSTSRSGDGESKLTDHTAFLATLAGIVGDPRHVIGPGGDFEPYVVDWRGRYHGKALAVVKPGSTQEVSSIVKACAAAGIAIVPQGGNTGMCGAATPLADRTTIVLRLDRLNKIRSVSRLGDSIAVD